MSKTSTPSLAVGLMLAAAATTGALAADKTFSVTEKVDLSAAPAKTWDTIKDFKGWQARHPAFAGTVITKVTDSTGRFATYTYTNGDLTDVHDVNNAEWQYGYDTSHRMITMKDPDLDANGSADRPSRPGTNPLVGWKA